MSPLSCLFVFVLCCVRCASPPLHTVAPSAPVCPVPPTRVLVPDRPVEPPSLSVGDFRVDLPSLVVADSQHWFVGKWGSISLSRNKITIITTSRINHIKYTQSADALVLGGSSHESSSIILQLFIPEPDHQHSIVVDKYGSSPT